LQLNNHIGRKGRAVNFNIGNAKVEIDLTNVFDKKVIVKLDIPLGLFRLDFFATVNSNENTPILVHAYIVKVSNYA